LALPLAVCVDANACDEDGAAAAAITHCVARHQTTITLKSHHCSVQGEMLLRFTHSTTVDVLEINFYSLS